MREIRVWIDRGLEIEKQNDGIVVHPQRYTEMILRTFEMPKGKSATNLVRVLNYDGRNSDENVPFSSAVSQIAYLTNSSRPDNAFAADKNQTKMAPPTCYDRKKEVKQFFRYLEGTTWHGTK